MTSWLWMAFFKCGFQWFMVGLHNCIACFKYVLALVKFLTHIDYENELVFCLCIVEVWVISSVLKGTGCF